MFINKLCVRKTANTNVPVCLCSSETAALLGFITGVTGKAEFPMLSAPEHFSSFFFQTLLLLVLAMVGVTSSI